MRKFLIKILTAAAVLLCLMGGGGLLAQDDLSRINAMLERSMAKQTILTEEDVRIYLAHIESIYLLRFDPSKLNEVISETGWSENRFAYVTTKVSVGLSLILRPDDPRNASIAEFAKPSGAERSIILRYQEDLAKAMEAVSARHSQSGSQN